MTTTMKNKLEHIRYKISGDVKRALKLECAKNSLTQYELVNKAMWYFIQQVKIGRLPEIAQIKQSTAEDISVKNFDPELYRLFLQACDTENIPAGPALSWAIGVGLGVDVK